MNRHNSRRAGTVLFLLGVFLCCWHHTPVRAGSLEEVQQRGVLRHLGTPYANFVINNQTGFDVDFVRLFAKHIGVRYEFISTTWSDMCQDLTGSCQGGNTPPKGDILACGVTVLPQRMQHVAFSDPTFPTQVWVVARADSPLTPILPQDTSHDIVNVLGQLRGKLVMGIEKTCTDPASYPALRQGKVICRYSSTDLNKLPAVLLRNEADAILLDVPDSLIALKRWPGYLKIIGPVSEEQIMAAAFAKNSDSLRTAFNAFLADCIADGTYFALVQKYYPEIIDGFPAFFGDRHSAASR